MKKPLLSGVVFPLIILRNSQSSSRISSLCIQFSRERRPTLPPDCKRRHTILLRSWRISGKNFPNRTGRQACLRRPDIFFPPNPKLPVAYCRNRGCSRCKEFRRCCPCIFRRCRNASQEIRQARLARRSDSVFYQSVGILEHRRILKRLSFGADSLKRLRKRQGKYRWGLS